MKKQKNPFKKLCLRVQLEHRKKGGEDPGNIIRRFMKDEK